MKYGLIGERLGHSFSKVIHNQLFDYEYELIEIPRDGLGTFLTERQFCAVNVTIPYKEQVIPYLDGMSEVARMVGAVNTIVNRGGKLFGDNTDFPGMIAMLRHGGIDLKDKHVLILGSGGTSKTALAVARELECRSVQRVSRSETPDCLTYAQAMTCTETEVILNTTPCGMFPHMGESAIDIEVFPRLTGVADAVYNPLRSKLVLDAKERGIPAAGGLYMLVAQAVFAAEIFTGKTLPEGTVDRVFDRLLAEKSNIVLIGMPGCGKTTVGRLLSEQLGMPLVDTDEEIVKRTGCAIPKLFEQRGEAGFRDEESAVVREVSARQGVIIATGGGAVLRPENVRFLKGNGRLYFLDRPLEALVATADRPLSADREALEKRYRERYGRYCDCCDCRVTQTDSAEQEARFIKEDMGLEVVGVERT